MSDDLLALSEEAEFEASVRAARERADARKAAAECEQPACHEREPEIVWAEQADVYRPRQIDAAEFTSGLSLPPAARPKVGRSVTLIHTAAHGSLREHLRSNTTVELGGLLVGEALFDPGLDIFIVVVEQALPAVEGDSTATSFSYTPAAWDALMPAWNRMRPDRTIVGSYHSHPGMGVFLSAVDRSTQEDAFPHDWQVAIVIDPIADTCGVFLGASGAPCPFALI